MCISNKLPGDADTAGLRATLGEPVTWGNQFQNEGSHQPLPPWLYHLPLTVQEFNVSLQLGMAFHLASLSSHQEVFMSLFV